MHTFTGTTDTDLTSAPKVTSVLGFHVAEDAGTPAVAQVLLRNGGATGDIVIQIELAASESKHFAAHRPMLFPAGVYVEIGSGDVTGSIQPG